MLLLLASCSKGEGATLPANAKPEEVDGEIRLDPQSPTLRFLKIDPVTETDAAVAAVLTGRVTFDEEHTQRISSSLDGRATKILAHLGDRVKPGQMVIELIAPSAGQLQADAQKSQQDLSLTKRSLDRAMTLKADGAVSEKEIAQLEADYRKAKADVGRTTAQLRSFGLSPSDPTISAGLRSQIAGIVVERNILVGQEVRADATVPLITISELETVWVVADVYEQDLGLVAKGAEVKVSVPAYPGESFAGTIGHVGEVVDPQSRTVKIRCIVPNPGARLKPAMFAKIELRDLGGKKVMEITSKAVLSEAKRTQVIVVEGDVFRYRLVDVGPDLGGKVRVLSGLKPGERIVTDGGLFLKNAIDNR